MTAKPEPKPEKFLAVPEDFEFEASNAERNISSGDYLYSKKYLTSK